ASLDKSAERSRGRSRAAPRSDHAPDTRALPCRDCTGSYAARTERHVARKLRRMAAEVHGAGLNGSQLALRLHRLDDELAESRGVVALNPLPVLEVARGNVRVIERRAAFNDVAAPRPEHLQHRGARVPLSG